MARNNDKTKKYKIDTENKDVTKKDNTKKMKKVKKQKRVPIGFQPSPNLVRLDARTQPTKPDIPVGTLPFRSYI